MMDIYGLPSEKKNWQPTYGCSAEIVTMCNSPPPTAAAR